MSIQDTSETREGQMETATTNTQTTTTTTATVGEATTDPISSTDGMDLDSLTSQLQHLSFDPSQISSQLERDSSNISESSNSSLTFPSSLLFPSSSSSTSESYPRTDLVIKFLPPSINNHEKLHALFTSFGTIRTCKLIRDKYTGASLGYGFITFNEEKAAQDAVTTWNGSPLDGKILRVSIARPIEQVRADRAQQVQEHGQALRITGLPPQFAKATLDAMFSIYGEIAESRILDASPRANPFLTPTSAYIRYVSETAAFTAIQNADGMMLTDSITPINVKLLRDSPGSSPITLTSILSNRRTSPGSYTHQLITQLQAQTPLSTMQPLHIRIPSDGTGTSAITATTNAGSGSTTSSTTSASTPITPIPNTFYPSQAMYGLTPDGMMMAYPHTYGYVQPAEVGMPTDITTGVTTDPYGGYWMYPQQYPSPRHVNVTHSMNMSMPVPVSIPSLSNVLPSIPSTSSQLQITPRVYGNNALTYDLITGMLTTANIQQNNTPANAKANGTSTQTSTSRRSGPIERPGECLFVFHLPPEFKDQDLFQLFSTYGTVLCCKVMADAPTQTSKGYGFVNFATYEDAQNAIYHVNGKRLGNKFLKVSFKKKPNQAMVMPSSSSTSQSQAKSQSQPQPQPQLQPISPFTQAVQV